MRRCWLIALACLCATSTSTAEELATIRSRLDEYYSSIDSLRILYTLQAPSVEYRCEIVTSGAFLWLKSESPEQRSITCFDGTTGTLAQLDKDDPAIVLQIQKRPGIPQALKGVDTPLTLWGMRMPVGDQPFNRRLAGARIIEDGSSDPGQVRVKIPDWPLGPKLTATVECTLSQPDDYLPSRMTLQFGPEDAPPAEYHVKEFRRVPHARLGREVSIPWVMEYGPNTVRVASVDLNPRIDRQRLMPQPSVGTVLVDATKPGPPKQTVHEPAAARQAAKERTATETRNQSQTNGSPIVAEPETDWSQRLPIVLLVFGLSLGAALLHHHFKAR